MHKAMFAAGMAAGLMALGGGGPLQGPGGAIGDGPFGCGAADGGAVTGFGSIDIPMGWIGSMQVTVEGLVHIWQGDLQIAVIGPDGKRYSLVDQLGGGDGLCGSAGDFNGADITFTNGVPPLAPSQIVGTVLAGPSNNPASAWNAGDLTSFPSAGSPIGGTWRLVIHDVSGEFAGSIAGWSLTPPLTPPAGTPCELATPISVGTTWTGSTSGSGQDALTSCGGASRAAWFRITAPQSQMLTASLCGSEFDTVLDVYSGDCDGLSPVACDDNACGRQSELTFQARRGTTYLIRVGGAAGQLGSFTFKVGGNPCTQTPCASDLDGSGVVNGVDLGILLAAWSVPADQPGCAGAQSCCADLNRDAMVNGVDLGILLSNWQGQAGGDPACR